MDVTTPIRRSFADEHVLGIDPPLRPDLPDVWRRRLNAFAGRALSDKALTAEQALRSGMQRLYGQALTPGTVEGLAAGAESDAIGAPPAEAMIQIAPGLGIARSGEDVTLGRTVRLALGDLPVILRVDHADALAGPGAVAADAPDGGAATAAERLRPELPRRLGDTLATIAANPESAALPHVAVLVAQPVVAEILGRPLDPCPPDPRDDAYVDLQRIDGARLALYLWPAEMVALDGGPDYALPTPGPDLRNRLAHAVFDVERLLGDGEMHPWEAWGLPLAVIGFDAAWNLAFLDRHAVARIGGTPRQRAALVPGGGDSRLWQAQIDQFTGQLAEQPSFDAASLQAAFVRLPPVGVLPPELFDPAARKQVFFPAGFAVTALPLPLSNLELAVADAAALTPLDRGRPEPLELLVPVPDAVYEPGLLETAEEDARFGQAIRDLREARQLWLVRRQMARRRYDRLTETVSGAVRGWPGSDLPLEENTPAPHVQTPVEVTRTRRFAAGSARRSHFMVNADASLTVAASDRLWLWVNVRDPAQFTGLSLRVAGVGPNVAPTFAKGVFWGAADAMPIAGETAGLAARRAGDLPEPRAWVRLEVPASAVWDAAGSTLAGFAIRSVEFSQRGGDVEWGAFGKDDAAGLVYTYIADDAPAGATLLAEARDGAGWPWAPVPGREDVAVPAFGTVVDGDVRRAGALDAFRARWAQPWLRTDLAAIDENGIGAFLAAVDARLKASNDAIDLGFVRARADIYRVRQIMLGADAASRLVTSPALADLAQRDEGARVTSRGISEFLTQAAAREQAAPPPPPPPPPPTGGVRGVSNVFQPTLMVLNSASVAAAARPRITVPAAARVPAAAVVATPLTLLSPLAGTTRLAMTTSLATPALSIDAAALTLSASRFRATDIQRQVPIAGLVERTVSVAERVTRQPAAQALEYAIASKAAVVATLAGLAGSDKTRPTGVELGDLPVPGFRNRATGELPTLAALIADAGRSQFDDTDTLPPNKHESDYFTAAVQAIDNSIAIMRLVEGRIAKYEELAAGLRDLMSEIGDEIDAAAAYLRAVDVEVAEARHDLGTAERLREEERARVEALNQRRAAILDSHVRAIAWRRPRAADMRDEVPLLEVASGLAPDPMATCRREHDDVPDEIHDYVQLLREVPVAWFPALAAMVRRIERLESAHAAIRTVLERAAVPRTLAAPVAVTAANRFLKGVQNAMVARRAVIENRRVAVLALDAARVAALSLGEAHTQLTAAATIGDLLAGSHRQPVLTRAAGEELDVLATIAGCLHESFGEVAPIVRLGWAEQLSEFDRPAPLANLAGLSGWGEVPVELRRTLQGFVDVLFSRIDRQQDEADDAINELVRVCLLMAAHAPVDSIIPAHLIEPAPARLGTRLFLALDSARVRKGMTMLIRDDADRIISQAVIDDIVEGRAQATVTHIAAAVTTLTPAMRFQLVGGGAR